ncbi:MAG: 3',5'-cyclic-nucleotide phosphodiesterase [Archangium sp.]
MRAFLVVLLMSGCATTRQGTFDAIVLGASGGIDESDLTSVWLSRAGKGEWVAFDAGTVVAGLRRAHALGAFGSTRPSEVFSKHLHGVFLSHPHLDHVAGLILSSPEAPKVSVFGLAPTLDALAQHVFGSPLWANFTDEGTGAIGRFHLVRMTAGEAVQSAAGFSVEAFELSHGPTTSTAFLACVPEGECALYLGDTGPDAVEKSERLKTLWARVKERCVRVIFIEVSFADPREDSKLFGHLTPRWLISELSALDVKGLNIVVTHIKPGVDGSDVRELISNQLEPLRTRGATVIVPRAGELRSF